MKFRLLLCITFLGMAQLASAQGPVTVVVKQVLEKTVQRSRPIAGRVHSRNDANLSTTVSGELVWVAEPGTLVNTGDVIARMDEAPVRLRKRELENLATREEVNQRYLEKELVRLQQLRETNSASQRLLDQAEANRDLSGQDLATIRTRIRQIEDELRRSRVIAGFPGVVAERNLRAGEYVRPGDTIVRLVDVDTLEIRFQLPVAYLGRVNVGDNLSIESREGAKFEATVRTLIPTVNANSQTFEARVDPALPGNSVLVAGQLVSVRVGLAGDSSGLMIPRDAVVLRAGGNYVYRIGADNIAERIDVELGEGEREWVSVTSELQGGDWVAVRGVERLEDGQTVLRSGS